jgi:hypothetical protein
MLEENTSLESLCVDETRHTIKAEDYIALATALHRNTTLKGLNSVFQNATLQLTADEDKRMAALLMKNYTLVTISGIGRVGVFGAILRLNKAGRRYLIEDGSISKGIKVLIRVNDDINCVLLHLLENPRLCDRSAVETVSSSGYDDSPTVYYAIYCWTAQCIRMLVSSPGGTRERASVHNGMASSTGDDSRSIDSIGGPESDDV